MSKNRHGDGCDCFACEQTRIGILRSSREYKLWRADHDDLEKDVEEAQGSETGTGWAGRHGIRAKLREY